MNFHWQDVVPGWFGLSLGEFVFYTMLIGGLCWTLVILAVFYERRKKGGEAGQMKEGWVA